jgi:ankyrin repeat protein
LLLAFSALLAIGARAHEIAAYEAALKAGDAAWLEGLLAAQDDPWPRSRGGEPLLHLAVSYFHAENEAALVRVLLAAGAEVDARDAGGSTALYPAAAYRCLDCVRQLLAAGAFVSARCAGGRTPLHVARAAAIPVLIEAGADTAARDDEGNVPLHTNWNAALLGPGVDVRNDYGFTPLHFAALRGDADGARFLLGHGADPVLESTRDYRYKEGLLADEWAEYLTFEKGMRPYDIARRRHDETKWSTGQYAAVRELLDQVTPRRGLLRR